MKSVGKQLEEARQAKNWTPELAARETKIKVDRIRDLELDDYSHFSSPTYARGFVRTYARALGIDEYRLLRQLDNKLPEDDNATFVQETGLPYVPEPSQVVHASSAHRTGLYVFLGLGLAVLGVSALVLFEAYRAGELPKYFAGADAAPPTAAPATNAAPVADADAPPRAVPVDPNDTTHAARAMPVDPNQAPPDTNAGPISPAVATAPAAAPIPVATPIGADASPTPAAPPTAVATAPAVPATPSDDSSVVPGAPRALPVDPASLTNAPVVTPVALATTTGPSGGPSPAPMDNAPVAVTPMADPNSPPPADSAPATVDPSTTTTPPRALPVDPRDLIAEASPTNPSPSAAPDTGATGIPAGPAVSTTVDLAGDHPVQESIAEAQEKKRLVLTASRDSFIRVTSLDAPQGEEVLYASVLRAGQSLAFGGHKFSVNVGVPSAVDIALDGVNYGPHSENTSPETFTIESHQP